jgi:hypothetical protein
VACCPEHIAVALLLAVIVGFAFTVIDIVSVAMQPRPLLPVTEYVVLTVGFTTTEFPVKAPGFHV